MPLNLDGFLNNFNQKKNQEAQQQKISLQQKLQTIAKPKPVTMNFYDKLNSAGQRIGEQVWRTAFGNKFVDDNNTWQSNLSKSQLKTNPNDTRAKRDLMVLNDSTRKASTPGEKALNYVGGTFGNVAPYVIGDGAIGAVDKGVTALTKGPIQTGIKLITNPAAVAKNPIAKKALSGISSGLAGSFADMSAKRALSNEHYTPKEFVGNLATSAALGGAGNVALHGLGYLGMSGLSRFAKGEVPTYTGKPSQSTLDALAPKGKGALPNKSFDRLINQAQQPKFEVPVHQRVKTPKLNPAENITIYRRGRKEGNWWSDSSNYVNDGFSKTRPYHEQSFDLANNKILDLEHEHKYFEGLMTPEELKTYNSIGNSDKRRTIMENVLRRNGYDALKLLDEGGDGKASTTYFLANPSKNGVSQAIKQEPIHPKAAEYKKEYQDAVQQQYNYLKNSMGKGVEYGTTGNGLAGQYKEVNGTYSVSKNPKWYQDFYAANGRKPNNTELRQLAEEHVQKGFADQVGNLPAWAPKHVQEIDNQIEEVNHMLQHSPHQAEALHPILSALQEDRANAMNEFNQAVHGKSESITARNEVAATAQPLKRLQQALKPGRDYEPITAAPKGSEDPGIVPMPINHDIPYKPGDPLPDTRSQIGTKATKTLPKLADVVDKGYIKMVDNLHRLNQVDSLTKDVLGRDLKPSESTHMLGLNSRGSDMISKQILTENMVNKNGEAVGKSLKDITMQVPKGKLKDFEDYLINKHAITRMDRGEKVFPDEMQMNAAKSAAKVKQYESTHPEFKDLSKQYYEYNRQLGQHWLVDSGVLSQKQWDGYLKDNPHYVPNNRIFKDIEKSQFGGGAKKGFANQSNPIKRAVGSQRQIVSPIESTIEHTAQYVKTAKRNEVMQSLINNIKQNPEAFQHLAEIVPTKKTPQSVMESLQKEGVDGLLENFNKGFDQKPDLTKGNIVRGIVDGQDVHVKVHDPHLLDALTNLTPKAQNVVIGALGQVTRVMKNLTTGINPVFSLTRNIFRDIPTAYTNSKTTNNPLTFSKDLVSSVVSVMKNDELYRSFKAVGGGHASPLSSDVKLLNQSKRSILPREKGLLNGLKHYGGKGLGALENLNNMVESAPRLAEYKRIAHPGNYESQMKGLYEANDVTVNFNKYGDTAKNIDAVIPYFNAAMQGLDKLGRTFGTGTAAQKTAAISKAFASVTIPSILLYTINHNNPDYQKVSNYIKDSNFLIPKGDGTFYKIPKPRELGVLFGSDVERTLRAWADSDPKAFNDFSTTIYNTFFPPTRSIIAPINDLRANKNYMDTPIVPGDMQNLSPQYQYDSKTSEVSKKLGNLFNISPKQLDYLAQSYGGVLGQLGIPATTKDGSIADTLKKQVTVDPVFSNDSQKTFYDKKTLLDQAHNDYAKQGVRSNNLNDPLRSIYSKASSNMGKIRKQMKYVQNDDSLTPTQRQAQLRQLQDMINRIADSVNSR